MNQSAFLFVACLLIPVGAAQACPAGGAARCEAQTMLADARGDQGLRYLETDDGNGHGPVSVRITTFDGSAATPGMWYERPRDRREDEASSLQRELPVAPFDRQPFDTRDR